jgi:hypothetical protein
MLANAIAGTTAEGHKHKGVCGCLVLVEPTVGVKLMRVHVKGRVVVVWDEAQVYQSTSFDLNLFDSVVLNDVPRKYCSPWSIHPSRFVDHCLRVMELFEVIASNICLGRDNFVNFLHEFGLDCGVLLEVEADHGQEVRAALRELYVVSVPATKKVQNSSISSM